MICKHCHAVFDEPSTYYDRSTGAYDEDCPECGSEDISEAGICPVCGETVANDEFENEKCCADCAINLRERLGDFLATLKKPEIEALDTITDGESLMTFWREH